MQKYKKNWQDKFFLSGNYILMMFLPL